MTVEGVEALELFGNKLIDVSGLGELLLRFGIDLLVLYIVIRLIFYPIYRERNYLFSYFIINISVFLVCILLSSIKLKIGFAFGLFAVFSIIRYRTEQIPIKEMSYLFIVIIIGVMNALSSNKSVSYAEMAMSNVIVVLAIFVLERSWIKQKDVVRRIRYEKIDNIKPKNHHLLIEDLQERLGRKIYRFEVESIDFLNDTARLKIFYRE